MLLELTGLKEYMSLNSLTPDLLMSDGGEFADSGEVPQEEVLPWVRAGTEGDWLELVPEAEAEAEPLLNLKTLEMPLVLSVPLSAY